MNTPSGGAPDPASQPAPAPRDDDFVESIPDELVDIVGDAEKAREVLRITASLWWAAPLPPPSMLAAYNDAYDGCAKDIVQMALDQSEHRKTIESAVVHSDIRLRQVGQILAFVISMTVIVGGLILIAIGRPVSGLVSIVVALGALAGQFIYSRRSAEAELKEKSDALELPPGEPPPDED